ncbi:MAG: nitrous oxide reductase family maturation protein NosD [Deltaproteobacteria bacterium]|nr:nitrous oxide reductase family maturation protein NosD [Deltaproteobacteria bacterium]
MRALRPCLVLGLVFASLSASAQPATVNAWRRDSLGGALQARVDALAPGETLRLAPGTYDGPVTIRVPGVTVEGGGSAIIEGHGEGTVVSVRAPGVVLSGLRIRGSGDSMPLVDAGISIESQHDVQVLNTVVEECLFGIDIANSQKVRVEGCEISSKPVQDTFRGDALRVWYSKEVEITRNHWHDTRDSVAWYSENVRFVDNLAERARYSVHGMYSKNLLIEGNRFYSNAVGIFLMYGVGSTVVNNVVRDAAGATGIGLGLKETSVVYAKDNRFVYCATGILIDNAPWEPNTRNWFMGNTLAFDGAGIVLANDREGNELSGNVFHSNRVDVDTEARRTSPGRWEGNVWDAYDGFDRDGDGVGDTPYVPRRYGDVLTGTRPATQFFRGAPILALIGLLERLVPLTEPIELLRDPKPRLLSSLEDHEP